MRLRMSGVVALSAVVVASLITCGCSDEGRRDWINGRDSMETQLLVESESICGGCVVFKRVVALGDTASGERAGPGFIEWTNAVVRDSSGRYWVAQREVLKVFDSTGAYVRRVGRGGAGPMEFTRPRPTYVDREGRVHIVDGIRETIIRPDFELHAERNLPIRSGRMVPLLDGRRYVMNILLWSPDRIGLPLHIANGSEVLYSFGAATRKAMDELTARRVLATDASGHIFGAPELEFVIEVWSATGRRITGFQGPPLNEHPVRGVLASEDNPPPNRITGMFVDKAKRLWVLSKRLKPDWLEHMEELVGADGRVALRPTDGSLRSYWSTRVDVIDLQAASIIATANHEAVLEGLIGEGLAWEISSLSTGVPQVVVWAVSVKD